MFLTENYKQEDDNLEFDFGVVNEDRYEGNDAELVEAIYESEMEFHNLTVKMMRLEHAAIVNEDAVLLEKGIKDFWKTFIGNLKKLWQKIKDFFAKVWAKIKSFFQGTEKWFANNKKEIEKALGDVSNEKYDGSYYTYEGLKKFASTFNQIGKKAKDSKESVDVKEYKNMVKSNNDAKGDEFAKAIKEAFRGKEVKDKYPTYSTVEGGIKNTAQFIKQVDNSFKSMKNAFSMAEKEANAAMKSVTKDDKKDVKKAHKVSATNYKNALSVMSEYKNIFVSTIKERLNSYGTIARKAMTEAKKLKKDDKDSKNESVLELY